MKNYERIKQLIFLDFDGVMTSVENGSSYLCGNEEKYRIDETIKSIFEKLHIAFPNLKVVLSSAWCNRGGVEDPTPIWQWKGINMRTPLPELYRWLSSLEMFYGTISTNRLDENGDHFTKCKKIKLWLEEHVEELDDCVKAVVLDDDGSAYNDLLAIDKLSIKNGKVKFLQTNYITGLTLEDIEKIIDFFT